MRFQRIRPPNLFAVTPVLVDEATKTAISDVATLASLKAGEKIMEGFSTISLENDIISKIGSRDIVTKV